MADAGGDARVPDGAREDQRAPREERPHEIERARARARREVALEEAAPERAEATGKTVDEVATQLESEIPIGRFAEPEEVAAAVAFLCSPAAAAISGINLPVDGGKTSSL